MNTPTDVQGARPTRPVVYVVYAIALAQILALAIILAALVSFGQNGWAQWRLQHSRAAVVAALQAIVGREAAWFTDHRCYATLPQLGFPVSTAAAGLYVDNAGTILGNATSDMTYRITLVLRREGSGGANGNAYWLVAVPLDSALPQLQCHAGSGTATDRGALSCYAESRGSA